MYQFFGFHSRLELRGLHMPPSRGYQLHRCMIGFKFVVTWRKLATARLPKSQSFRARSCRCLVRMVCRYFFMCMKTKPKT